MDELIKQQPNSELLREHPGKWLSVAASGLRHNLAAKFPADESGLREGAWSLAEKIIKAGYEGDVVVQLSTALEQLTPKQRELGLDSILAQINDSANSARLGHINEEKFIERMRNVFIPQANPESAPL